MTNIDKRLIVRRREVYGVAKFYPMNTTAKLFAEIAGTKTLTEQTIGLAQTRTKPPQSAAPTIHRPTPCIASAASIHVASRTHIPVMASLSTNLDRTSRYFVPP